MDLVPAIPLPSLLLNPSVMIRALTYFSSWSNPFLSEKFMKQSNKQLCRSSASPQRGESRRHSFTTLGTLMIYSFTPFTTEHTVKQWNTSSGKSTKFRPKSGVSSITKPLSTFSVILQPSTVSSAIRVLICQPRAYSPTERATTLWVWLRAAPTFS